METDPHVNSQPGFAMVEFCADADRYMGHIIIKMMVYWNASCRLTIIVVIGVILLLKRVC